MPLALITTAALPWTAFIDGHPYRIRYMVPLIAAEAVVRRSSRGGIWKRGAPVDRRAVAAARSPHTNCDRSMPRRRW